MRGFWKELTSERLLWLGVALFVIAEMAVVLRSKALYWDEAVFLTMGKYLATASQQGFWEHIRPPMLPLVTGTFFHTGIAVLLTKVLLIGLAALAGVLLYGMLVQQVRPALALVAALLLLFSQVWFSHANLVLTDVFSASVVVMAAYLYMRNKLLLAGLFAAVAFLIRFPAGLVLAGLLITQLAVLYRKRSRKSLNGAGLLLLGFSAPVLVWLLINLFFWGNTVSPLQAAFRPLLDGFVTASAENAGLYEVKPGFYLLYILRKLPVLLLGVIGIYALRRLPAGTPLAVTALLGLLFYEWLPNDQLRFLVLMLPGLVTLAAYGANIIAERFSLRKAAVAVFALSLAFVLIDDAGLVAQYRANSPDVSAYHEYLVQRPVSGFVLVSDPVTAWHIPNRSVPVYYGLFPYAHSFMPAADAIVLQRSNICSGCNSSLTWNAIESSYTLVEEKDSKMIYLRTDLLR